MLSWLREFLEVSLHPEALAQRLTMAGCEVTHLTAVEKDWIFECEVTPNRPDLLSHLGVARETAAVLGRRFHMPRWLQRELLPLPSGSLFAGSEEVSIRIEDLDGCFRYVGVCVEGVKVAESPPALAQRLIRLGIRPINNVVDVTNLVLLEIGQPLHAFDLDRLEGAPGSSAKSMIRVRRATAGETLVTLDGVSRVLTPEILVIADGRRPVALAGVMGGKEAEIGPNSRRLLLESAWFDPVRIRRAARGLKISSESSYRFERGVDPAVVPRAALRAARWIARLTGGTIAGGPIDVGDRRLPPTRISLRPQRAQQLLGARITPAQQRRFLERLGCRVRSAGSRGWRVQPPSWRSDLKIPEDLHEELVRLWGYDRCPATLPPVVRRKPSQCLSEGPDYAQQEKIRRLLAEAGFQEIMTYSLVNPEDHSRVKFLSGGTVILENPLSLDQAVMRKTLVIGALQTLTRNLHFKTAASFQFFELGRVYFQGLLEQKKPPMEQRTLGLLVAGTPDPDWAIKPIPLGIFHLKGVAEILLERLRVGPLSQRSGSSGHIYLTENSAITFHLGDKPFGVVGLVDPKILADYEIPGTLSVAYAELDLETMAAAPAAPLRVQPLPKVPPVVRDLAILVAQDLPQHKIAEAILEAAGPLLKESRLVDLYQGPQVPGGKKSLCFRLSFLDPDRTLTEEEVTGAVKGVVNRLNSMFQAMLR